MTFILAVVVCLAALLAVGIVLIRFNLKRLHVIRHVRRASAECIESVYGAIERLESEELGGYVLARTNQAAGTDDGIISIPEGLADFPWSGRTVAVDSSIEQAFRFVRVSSGETRLRGTVCRPVRVPRRRLRSGKLKHVFSPSRYLNGSHELAGLLDAICPEHPEEALVYLMMAGAETFEFEPSDQARIHTPPSWIQEPEWPSCAGCKSRMSLIVQLPGSLLTPRRTKGTLYWFGCKRHPETTTLVGQFT